MSRTINNKFRCRLSLFGLETRDNPSAVFASADPVLISEPPAAIVPPTATKPLATKSAASSIHLMGGNECRDLAPKQGDKADAKKIDRGAPKLVICDVITLEVIGRAE